MQGRYHGLDALRGVAAIAVMLFHFHLPSGTVGYLSVDVFFLLSGFVIDRTYEPRYRDGMGLAEFAWRRLLRLYPVYFIGAALATLGGSSALVFVFLPTPGYEALHIGNWPLWSLPLELAASLFFYAFLVRLRTMWLIAVALLCGFAWAAITVRSGILNLGDTWATALAGIPRIGFSFLLGAVIGRTVIGRRTSLIAWPVILAFGVCLIVAPPVVWTNLVIVLLVAPVMMAWLARNEVYGGQRFAAWLGNISYPLYAIHAPIDFFVSPMLGRVPTAAFCVALATVIYRFYDTPVRRMLGVIREVVIRRRRGDASSATTAGSPD